MMGTLNLDATKMDSYDNASKKATLGTNDSNVSTAIEIPAATSASAVSSSAYTTSQISYSGINNAYLYNWHAAIAYPDGTTVDNVSTTPETSICPRGWQLPNATGATRSFYNLLTTTYGATTKTAATANPLSFVVPTGSIHLGPLSGTDYAYYWSRTPYYDSAWYTYRLLIFNAALADDGTWVDPAYAHTGRRAYLHAIRCVAQ